MTLPTLKFNVERWKFNKEYQVYVSNMGHFKNIHKEPIPIGISQKGYCSVKTPKGYKKHIVWSWKLGAQRQKRAI